MNKFTVTQIDGEIIATYDDGGHPIVMRQKATGDFIFDCACLVDTLSVKVYKNKEKEGN